MEKIYFGGGCFWGVEAYFANIDGINSTLVGYANGNKENVSYEEVRSEKYGFVEAVEVNFNAEVITLKKLLDYFFNVIDPISINQQGHDVGIQYRTGAYYTNITQKKIIEDYIALKQKSFKDKIAVEVLSLNNFYKAEEYHQKYLDKNPNGYCHISRDVIKDPKKHLA